jgi:poly-gamma-glutamate capsule biosynthesis protein CapA/YwtB (metallophosphatase superfamily)
VDHEARELRRRQARRRLRRQRVVALVSLLLGLTALAAALAGLGVPVAGHAALEAAPGKRAPPLAAEARTFDIVASGDLLVHSPVWERARALGHGRYDFRPLFAGVRPIVKRAALALCHIETPMGAGPPTGYPIFNSPPELARAVAWTGWDICSTASNHAVDKGQFGIERTLRALDRAGVRHTGSFRTRREARQLLFVSVRGLRVAFLSYTYSTNGVATPYPWSVNLISTRTVVADAREARRRGADLIIANLHWGDEFVHEPNLQQRDLARYLLRRGIVDVIVGQHAHVVQPIGRIRGRFVVFGEGNLLSNQTGACCPAASQDGLIAVIHVRAVGRRAEVTGVDYVPIFVEHPSLVVQPAGVAFNRLVRQGRAQTARAQALLASYRRTVAYAGRARGVLPWPRLLRR